jgi:hypothetical protein
MHLHNLLCPQSDSSTLGLWTISWGWLKSCMHMHMPCRTFTGILWFRKQLEGTLQNWLAVNVLNRQARIVFKRENFFHYTIKFMFYDLDTLIIVYIPATRRSSEVLFRSDFKLFNWRNADVITEGLLRWEKYFLFAPHSNYLAMRHSIALLGLLFHPKQQQTKSHVRLACSSNGALVIILFKLVQQ